MNLSAAPTAGTAATPASAMILAAGRGQRMRPLTDHTPKPLLPVRGKPLMQWPMEALALGGFERLVVNTGWLGEQISDFFGTSPASNGHDSLSKLKHIELTYSHEEQDFGYALETAGGIARALPLLGEVFWVLAGDVYVPDFAFTRASVDRFSASGKLAHLWLVPNPPHNPKGDFGLSDDGLALNQADVEIHLQHHRPVPPRAVRGAVVRRSCMATRRAQPRPWRRCCARPWTPARSAPSCTPAPGPTWARPSGWPN